MLLTLKTTYEKLTEVFGEPQHNLVLDYAMRRSIDEAGNILTNKHGNWDGKNIFIWRNPMPGVLEVFDTKETTAYSKAGVDNAYNITNWHLRISNNTECREVKQLLEAKGLADNLYKFNTETMQDVKVVV